MSERNHEDGEPNPDSKLDSNHGPNLKLIYALIFAALAVAIGIAALVVLPFYQRR